MHGCKKTMFMTPVESEDRKLIVASYDHLGHIQSSLLDA